MEENKNISVPQSGMIRDFHPSALEPNQYSFAMNANIEGEDGSVNFRQNEPSNIKCMEFDGYNVVGYKNDLSTNNTYFFLAHPTNKTSKIVFFESNEFASGVEDIQQGSGIDIHRVLGERFENSSERYYPTCGAYRILIEDDIDDPCINFSISHPIKTIEIKHEKCGDVIYWTDGYNPPRWVSVDKALNPDSEGYYWYRYHGYRICGAEDEPIPCKIACEKLRIFPFLDTPCVEAAVMEFGGSLRAGVYQFCVALCDQFGNETTNYHSLTGPVHVFDRNDILVKDGKWGARTNLGIRLDVSNLDKQAMYYKIGVLQKTVGYNGEAQPAHDFMIEGVHPITEQTVYYLSDLECKKTSLVHLSRKMPVYKTSKGVTTVANHLLQYGLTSESEWNLQPVCNLLGHFLQWQTSVSTDSLYQDGVACAKYACFMRDEVYPFAISFLTKTGYETAAFNLIPRPKSVYEAEVVSDGDTKDIKSILTYVPNCADFDRKERWQFENTAKNLGPRSFSRVKSGCNNEINVPRSSVVEQNIFTHEKGGRTIDFTFTPEYFPEDFLAYIENNPKVICETALPEADTEVLCEAINGDDDIQPPVFPDGCSDIVRVKEKDVTTIPRSLVKDFKYNYTMKGPEEMSPMPSSDIYVNSDVLVLDDAIATIFGDNGQGRFPAPTDIGGNIMNSFIEFIQLYQSSVCGGKCSRSDYDSKAVFARSRRLFEAPVCTVGCSIDSAADMPEIWRENVNLIRLSRVTGYSIVNGDLIISGSKTEEALDEVMEEWRRWARWSNMGQYHLDATMILTCNNFIEGFTAATGNDYLNYMKNSSKPQNYGDISDADYGECLTPRSTKELFFFHKYVSKNAKWYKITRPDSWDDKEDTDISERSFILEIYGSEKISPDNPDVDSTAAKYFRVSFFSDLEGTPHPTPLTDGVDMTYNSNIFNYNHHGMYLMASYAFRDKKTIYVAVDSMMCAMGFAMGQNNCNGWYYTGHSYCTAVLPAEIGIGIRRKEIKYVNVKCTSMTVRRAAYFEATCISCGDTPLNCDPRPYEYGDFGYWQSVNKYPANFELYDSTRVRIDTSKGSSLKRDIVSKLTEYYGEPSSDKSGLYFTGNGADYPEASPMFCQKPIRHYKFPDNIISPFQGSTVSIGETESYIYPLGVTIDENTISAFLDIAVDSGLITQDQRDVINGYKIYRGDRTLNRSVIGTGIGFDMYKYKDDNNNESLYANYPYNDLSDDRYNYASPSRTEYIHHPYNGVGNVNYTFHSPDYHFNKPELGTEVRIEGYQLGSASGVFTNVKDYPKYVLLGPSSIAYASKMARIEALANAWTAGIEAAMEATDQLIGLSTSIKLWTAWGYLALTLANIGKNYIQDYNRLKNDWLNILSNRGIPDNFAFYYSSKGYYNSFTPVPSNQKEETLRGLYVSKYIDNGRYSIVSPSASKGEVVVVNNADREESIFLSFGSDEFILNTPSSIRSFDDSRVEDGGGVVRDVISGPVRQRGLISSFVSSPYFKMKRFNPGQYGGIENIRWISIGGCGKLEGKEVDLFGGDIYISRFSVKRKFPMFYYTAFGLADLLPFALNDYRNIGYPKYFLDYETKESTEVGQDIKFKHGENSVETTSMPFRESAYNLNNKNGSWYIKGKFYTYFYGIPQFLVESEINCNERLKGVELYESFFPAVGDYVEWTQQSVVPISKSEEFMISPIYMSRSMLPARLLPATYDKTFWDCSYQRPNGVIWSRADNSENSMTDPWLQYNPLDVHEFPSRFGDLVHLKGIESEIVLGRFKNQVSLFNTVDILKERVDPAVATELGTGGLFAGRSMDYNHTDLGYSGSQSTEMISTEYGHFWVDAKRGQVFMVKPNGEGLQPLHPGMSHWLQEHLPFKILRYDITNIENSESPRPMNYDDVDNKFAGLGLSLGWDNRFKRVFVTKKDYIPVKQASRYTYKESKFYYDGSEVRLTDPEFFLDVSFTLAYSCKNNEWISYYSFTPDYYIEHMNYFQTGNNFADDFREVGLWSHLLTTQSYQVFYGKKYPFMIELPVRGQYVNKILSNIQYRMESRRYHSEIDFAIRRSTGFNKAWVYNHRDNSGLLNLIPEEKNNWAQKLRYPRAENGGMSIIATEESEGWAFNDFFNVIKNNENNVPQWIKDINDIEKEINADAIYYNSIWKDRLRGDWFLVRYCNDDETRFKMIFRWQSNDEKIINR